MAQIRIKVLNNLLKILRDLAKAHDTDFLLDILDDLEGRPFEEMKAPPIKETLGCNDRTALDYSDFLSILFREFLKGKVTPLTDQKEDVFYLKFSRQQLELLIQGLLQLQGVEPNENEKWWITDFRNQIREIVRY